jgi:hypothetical protein
MEVNRREFIKKSVLATGGIGSLALSEIFVSEYVIASDSKITDEWKDVPLVKGSTVLGATFRPSQARWFGLNPNEVYSSLLSENIGVIRLGIYWNEVLMPDGSIDLSSIERLVHLASQKNKKLIVTVGMKAPGYPEYYIPSKLVPKISNGGTLSLNNTSLDFQGNMLSFIETSSASISSWQEQYGAIYAIQLENEPFLKNGVNRWSISDDLLLLEFNTLQVYTKGKIPVVITGFLNTNMLSQIQNTFGAQDSLSQIGNLPNITGYDYYPVIPGISLPLGRTGYLDTRRYPLSGWEKNRLSKSCSTLIASEVQAEPWELVPKNHYPKGMAPFSCKPEDIIRNYNFCMRGNPPQSLLFWGFEYMYSRYLQGDTQYIDALHRITG